MSQRAQKVAEAIKREVSALLLRGIKDERVQAGGLVSVTRVEVGGDLRHAHIYVSVFGADKEAQEQILAGLQSALGYIRSEIGKRVPLRFTPEIQISLDYSLSHGADILALLDKIASEDKARAEG